MSLPIAGSQAPPPLHFYNAAKRPTWERRQRQPGLLRLQRPKNWGEGCTRKDIDVVEDSVSASITAMIEAGVVSKEDAYKRTWLHRVVRRYTWPLQLAILEFKAFKKCWYEFKNKDELWRFTAVMEEQGENPRWQGEMTFTIQPRQYTQMVEAGQWIEFPSPENIKWFYAHPPGGVKKLYAKHQRHWGPNSTFLTASIPFGERDGRIVRHPKESHFPRKFHLFVEQKGPRRRNNCGHMG
ncbi:hypothetical protein GQX73_g794 [Xylaria multiplex]|uniref:Uncharacterized protein n=1 Tax=Xylaria multiplex TaxID=323545 RepID=A0A7C8IXA9_9PEZI|nr:hypothetical protein GQX73_g794 [Xylaria multiplex]